MSLDELAKKVKDFLANSILSTESKCLTYGTSGYRCHAKYLKGIALRIGAVACLCSINQNGLVVGIMITASHNYWEDNGIKLIYVDGGMLPLHLERSIVDFITCEPDKNFEWMDAYLEKDINASVSPTVYLGMDTRESSCSLADEVKKGVAVFGGRCVDFGCVTTPQLHFLVQLQIANGLIPDPTTAYTNEFADKFVNCFANISGDEININVDCAHGVGSIVLLSFTTRINLLFNQSSYPQSSSRVCINLFNTQINEKKLLNKNCGADYVKLYNRKPELTPPNETALSKDSRWATIDGDADRLLYFFCQDDHEQGEVVLFDGDRIACLFATFIKHQLNELKPKQEFRIGVVQTAFANAASTDFLKSNIHVPVYCTPTGVKHLHNVAKELDFGIYFEANGHGTVLFSKSVKLYVEQLPESNNLRSFVSLVNSAIGDALTDLLLVEYVLAVSQMCLLDWIAMYTEYPSRQLKVFIADTSLVKTTDCDRRIVEPYNLQIEIDAIVAAVDAISMHKGIARAFVRPSGTENMIRVYAESETQFKADWIAKSIAVVIFKKVNGVAPEPEDPGKLI